MNKPCADYPYFYALCMERIQKLINEEMDKRVNETYLPKNFHELLKINEE